MSKRTLISATVFLLWSICASAQMTDSQVIELVKDQYAAGMDKKQIAANLLEKGVSLEQMQKIMDNYHTPTASVNVSSQYVEDVDRSRRHSELSSSKSTTTASGEKKIFGHDIFQSDMLTFQSNMNIPAPASYLLGPGDEIILDIYGSSQTSSKMKVAPDGSVTIPNERPVYVSGLTMEQAQQKVRKTIGANYHDSEIKLSLGQTRTVLVNVMGEVGTPGTYSLSAFSTVFNALYLAGGVNTVGTLRDIKVSRQGKVVTTIDVYEFILNGNLPGNIMLQDDDVIIVGAYDRLVNIGGQVKRPMYYEMKPDESLQTLLDFAGGYTGDALRDNIRVERKDVDGLTVHTVNEKDLALFFNEDGDNVIVLPSKNRYRNTVSVEGAVFFPGNYRLGDNVTSVLSLIEQAGGLEEMAVTDLAVIIRLKEDRTLKTIHVPLSQIMKGQEEDIQLQNEDKLLIASNYSKNNLRTISILGEVFNPGTIRYSEGETVASLITRAGGLLESADSSNIQIARRITTAEDDSTGQTLATIYQVSKDSDMELMPFDIVTVTLSEYYKEQRLVTVSGEVKNAGTYALETAGERLSSIVMRAGGLKSTAFVQGAKIRRKMTSEELMIMSNELAYAQTQADTMQIQSNLASASYIVGADLGQALDKPGSAADPVLRENDVIIIPQMDLTVKISGAVLSPNTVNYEEGKGLSYYLNQAGGITSNGRRHQSFIIYANGTKSLARKGQVQAGCEIVVPTKEKKEFNPQIATIGLSSASVLASIAAVISNILK